MKKTTVKIPSLKNVTEIRINRIALWERIVPFDENQPVWVKISGGLGFNPVQQRARRSSRKQEYQMQRLVNKRLFKKQRTLVFQNRNIQIFEDIPVYKWWISGKTLNLVNKSLPVPEK
jgi:hypothetical protein